jgi:nucleotide-binding universal stress UspA family protein
MKKVIALIDFTGVCQLALEHTSIVARQSLSQVTLLHIAPHGQEVRDAEIREEIRTFASQLEEDGIPFSIHIDYGAFFDIVGTSIHNLKADLIIVGTHGIKGIKQNFVGSNILRLIRQIDIPALIIQGHSGTPMEGYLKILVPLLGKTENEQLIEPVAMFASVFNSEIHFLTYFTTENEAEAQRRTAELNKEIADKGLKTAVDLEKTGTYNNNYSRSIVEFADIEDAELIALIISNKGFENYFSEDDQENILLNRLGKPVLCI